MAHIALSPAQHEAVRHRGGPALVSAGAGSGKTRVLTAKVAHLIEEGLDPSRILAITFTNKAAKEMVERLQALTGRAVKDFPWVRTFHSACLMILKAHADRLGFKTPLNICVEYQQEKHLKAVLMGLNADPKKFLGPVRSAISMAKNTGDPKAYLATVKIPGLHASRLEAAWKTYDQRLRAANAVDFDDILLLTRDLLRTHEDVRSYYQDYFAFVLIDEYQDVNDLQEELATLWCRNGNLFAVGDDYQSIYRFRGSNIENFLQFQERHEGARVFLLEQNYRSTREIVECAEALIKHNRQMEKNCFSEKRGGKLEARAHRNEYAEAEEVARQARRLHALGVPYSAMAVLYRSNALSLPFEQELRKAAVPYKLKGDRSFFDRLEVADVNAYLQAALHPYDDVAFERIVNTPRRGIGPAVLEKVRACQSQGERLQAACLKACAVPKLLSAKVARELKGLIAFLSELSREAPEGAIRRVLEEGGYKAHLIEHCKGEQTREFQNRMENLDFLLYAASRKESLEAYLEEVALDTAEKDEADEGKKAGLTLSTIHGAKGLEWEAVFVVGLEEGLLPHWRSEQEGPQGVEEERRLAYVALTRATRFLELSCVSMRRGREQEPSRFLEEAGFELYD